MLIEIVGFDQNTLTIKVGLTKQECLESKVVRLPTNGFVGIYPVLLNNRKLVEEHLILNTKAELMVYKFPDGVLPTTEL